MHTAESATPGAAPRPEVPRLDHLRALEAESIAIMREVVAEFERPVMLYSIGKDSSVLLRLAQKAFFPGPIPFPLLHIDTTYKFREMIEFRDNYTREIGARLIVHTNTDAIAAGTQPFAVGTQRCCGLLKTRALLDGLEAGQYDAGSPCATKRASGTRSGSVPNSGTCSTAACARARASACSRCRTGPRLTCGSTSTRRRSRWCRCISRSRARSSSAAPR
jgi:hypothetical protein